jgi:transposase
MKTMDNPTTLYVGIDVSKLTLDVCLRNEQGTELFQIKNNAAAIGKLVKKLQKTNAASVAVGMENTGRYNYPLYGALVGTGFTVFVINPLHLKKSMGLVRGKNDRVDAERIAAFIETHRRTLKPWVAKRTVLAALQALLAKRTQLVKMKKQLTVSDGELGLLRDKKLEKFLTDDGLVQKIERRIEEVEARIDEAISEDDVLCKQYRLLRSVPGIGKVLAWQLLVKTNEFKDIADPSKLACYAGVVPFDYRSGTSVRGKPRVSLYADKNLKSLLHLAAMSAIRLTGELRDYYRRKVAEGKNKMSTLNAVRNKIVHRACAVIKNQSPYVPIKNDLILS